MVQRVLPFLLHLLVSISLCLLTAGHTLAQQKTDIVLGENLLANPVGPFLRYHIDENQQWEINDILKSEAAIPWQSSTETAPSFGYSNATFWFHFNVKNTNTQFQKWLLEVKYSLTDYLNVYIVENNQIIHKFETGDQRPFNARPIHHRNFLFPLEIKAHQTLDIYIRQASQGTNKMPLNIWEEQTFYEEDQKDLVAHGIFFGVMIIMIFYNLSLFLVIRERAYIFYIFYVFSLTMQLTTSYGFAYQYLWPNASEWNNTSITVSGCSTILFSSCFIIYFLDLKKHSKRLYQAEIIIVWVAAIIVILSFILPYSLTVRATTFTAMFAVFIALFSGYLLAYKGVRTALFFSIAWTIFLVSGLLYTLQILAIIPHNFVTYYSPEIGACIEVALLSIAFSDRYLEERREKYNAKNALLEAEKSSYQANAESKAKSDFLAKMSHEIRTPMNGILGLSELLQDTHIDKQQKHYIDTIHNSGLALLKLINDVLDYSKVEAGKMELESIPFNLPNLAAECLSVFQAKQTNSKVTLNADIDEKIPPLIVGDPTRLRQILLNFISNAIKFTESGEVKVSAKLQEKTSKGLVIRLAVSDTGIGLTEEQRSKLFQAFQQAETSTSRQYGGTGLGLAICKDLVELMGGEIGVNSLPEKGSEFWFTLGLLEGAPDIKPITPEQHSPQEENVLKKLKVLIAEDNTVNQMVIKGMLKKVGVQYHLVENGQEGLDYIKEHRDIDVILMDCEMPVLDGFAASDAIYQYEKNHNLTLTPIIALTAHTIGDFETKCQQHHMQHFLTKPLDSQAVHSQLSKITPKESE